MNFKSINPSTLEIIWEGRESTKEEIESSIAKARVAFRSWADLSVEDRKNFLNKFVDRLEKEKEDFALLMSMEMGKPLWETRLEVQGMLAKLDLSYNAIKERNAESIDERGVKTTYRPHGVIVVFGPFNFPGSLALSHIIPALLAGNTIVYKPSEQTPKVGERLFALFSDLPKGVLELVQGGKEPGVVLANSNDIDGLFFTGSSHVGKLIHKSFAGDVQKILALEMGGNNPLVVWDYQDLQSAISVIINSSFMTSGQRCTCARRLIISKEKYDELIPSLVEEAKKISMGVPYIEAEKPNTPFMGPLINSQTAEGIFNAFNSLKDKGAKVLLEMEKSSLGDCFLTPGILDVTNLENREDVEYFGPLLQVIQVEDFDQGILEANDTIYGLSAGIISNNQALQNRFLKEVRAGIININSQTTGASSASAFGGIGMSGNHRPSAYFAADYCSYPVVTTVGKC